MCRKNGPHTCGPLWPGSSPSSWQVSPRSFESVKTTASESMNDPAETPPGVRSTESMEIELPVDTTLSVPEATPLTSAFAPTGASLGAPPTTSDDPPLSNHSRDLPAMQRASSLFLHAVQRSGVEVFAFGCGSDGQLGVPIPGGVAHTDGTETSMHTQDDAQTMDIVPVPQSIEVLRGKNVVGISAGAFHTAAVTADGDVYTWGCNDNGQLGVRGKDRLEVPTRIETLENVSVGFVSCGSAHTVAVAEDGSVLGWGKADAGELGIGHGPPSTVQRPKLLSALKDAAAIARVAAGDTHTLFLDAGGCMHASGDGFAGALGLKITAAQYVPRPILKVWPVNVIQVSAGDAHSAALTSNGAVFTWGRGRSGQLGHSTFENCHLPTCVRALTPFPMRQISCGSDFTLALSDMGDVWSFGQGRWGATGLAHHDAVCIPQRISALTERAVQVSAGGRHTLVLTENNQVWATGCNENGQCGNKAVGTSLLTPELVAGLPARNKVLFVAAGGDHSIVVVQHDATNDNEPPVADTAAGAVELEGRAGLGVDARARRSEQEYGERWLTVRPPSLVSLARVAAAAADGKPTPTMVRDVIDAVERTFAHPAALLQAFAADPHRVDVSSIADVAVQAEKVASKLKAVESTASELPPWQRNEFGEEYYEASLAAQDVKTGMAISPWKLDVPAIAETFANLLKLYDASVAATLGTSTVRLLDAIDQYLTAFHSASSPGKTPPSSIPAAANVANDPRTNADPSSELQESAGTTTTLSATSTIDAGRGPTATQSLATSGPLSAPLDPNLVWVAPTLFVLLQNPLAGDPTAYGGHIVPRLGRILAAGLPAAQRISVRRALQSLLGRLPAETLAARCARPVNRYIARLVQGGRLATSRVEVLVSGVLLDVIRQANVDAGEKIQYSEFYNRALSRSADLRTEYVSWLEYRLKAPQALVSLCQMPFLLDPEAKSKILHGEAAMQKQQHMSTAAMHAFFQGLNPSEAGFLRLAVRRTHVVEDALNGLVVHADGDLKKPLKVTFVSAGVPEPAQDEGGVRKEFFQLVCRDLFRPEFGMFHFDEQTRMYWFNSASLESESEFGLVGALLGLAIYNGVLLDVHFPMVLYKKLLNGRPDFSDLKAAFPELGRGLQALLDYQPAEDVEAVFCRTFEVEYEYYGEIQRRELKPGGASIPVTGDNRDEYVRLYTQWVLTDSVETQFKAFARGFLRICGGPALSMFIPSELELLVCGLPHLDFDALQAAARYEGGFSPSSAAVKWMWEVVQDMSLEKKRQFLSFVTGSDRAPVGGLGSLQLLVQRAGPDTDRLPTTHTCFDALLLPEYSSKSKLQERLLTAITNAEGFGLQ